MGGSRGSEVAIGVGKAGACRGGIVSGRRWLALLLLCGVVAASEKGPGRAWLGGGG